MRPALLSLVLLVTLSPLAAQGLLPQLREDARVAPTRSDNDPYERARAIREAGKVQLSSPAQVARFARLGQRGPRGMTLTDRVVPVSGDAKWPDDTAISLIIAYDPAGRALALLETPVSESGDWYNEYIHFFDAQGRTVAFERYSGFFNGCPGAGKERSVTYYSSVGRLVAREYRLEEGGPRCPDFYYRYPYSIYPDWSSAARAGRLPLSAGSR